MDKLSRRDAERILDGSVEPSDPRLGTLASFVDEARETFGRPASPDVQARHVIAMAQEKVTLRGERPSTGIRRRLGRASLVSVAAGVVFAAGSALAATGHLPSPAQTVVSDAARFVGVHVRGGNHASANGRLHGATGKEQASENKATADAFTDAKKSWTACVALKARQHTGPAPFDPEASPPAGCGPKPQPQTFKPQTQGGGAPAATDDNKGGQPGPGEKGKHNEKPHDGQPTGTTEGQPSPSPDHGGNDQGSSGDGVSGGHSDGAGHGAGRG